MTLCKFKDLSLGFIPLVSTAPDPLTCSSLSSASVHASSPLTAVYSTHTSFCHLQVGGWALSAIDGLPSSLEVLLTPTGDVEDPRRAPKGHPLQGSGVRKLRLILHPTLGLRFPHRSLGSCLCPAAPLPIQLPLMCLGRQQTLARRHGPLPPRWGSWLWPGLALTVVAILGVNLSSPSLPLSNK